MLVHYRGDYRNFYSLLYFYKEVLLVLKIEQILRNEKGENVLNDSFDTITIKAKAIVVKKNGFYGMYNGITFRKILDCEWEKIVLNGNFILPYKHSQIALFDYEGNQILPCEWNEIILYEHGILASQNGLQGFFKYDGSVLLECVWKRIEPFREVLIAYRGNRARRTLFDYNGKQREE